MLHVTRSWKARIKRATWGNQYMTVCLFWRYFFYWLSCEPLCLHLSISSDERRNEYCLDLWHKTEALVVMTMPSHHCEQRLVTGCDWDSIQQTQQLYITPQKMIKTLSTFTARSVEASLLSHWYEMCDYCHVVILPPHKKILTCHRHAWINRTRLRSASILFSTDIWKKKSFSLTHK